MLAPAVNRVALAVAAVVMAVAILVLIARQNTETPAPVADAAPVVDASEEDWDAGEDLVLEVKELPLGDGATNQQSIRIEHPDPAVQKKLRDWLEPREAAAVTTGAAIDCHAQVARTTLISITCSSLAATAPAEPTEAGAADVPAAVPTDGGSDSGADDAGPSGTGVKYESLTIRISRRRIKELALTDMLRPDAGEAEVVAACKRSADPPSPCVWPPTNFAVSPGGTLFLCHDSHCVDIDGEAELLRPELR